MHVNCQFFAYAIIRQKASSDEHIDVSTLF